MVSKKTKVSQCKNILEHLQKGNTITAIDALNKFGCFRLASRIYNLKQDGHTIECEIVRKNKKKFARYSLIN